MANDDPTKESFTLLYFEQAGVTRIFTNWSAGWTDGFDVASPLPGLEVRLAPNTGTLEDKSTTLEFLTGRDAWLDSLVSGDLAVVTLRVVFVMRGIGPGASGGEVLSEQGRYRLTRAVRSPEHQLGLGRLEFHSCKQLLTPPLGMAATPRCAWSLGDKTCGVVLVTETETVDYVKRSDLKVVGLSLNKLDFRYWHRGFVTFNGLSLGIRDWDGDPGNGNELIFRLTQPAPQSWTGQVVTFTPGCDKTPEVCENRWANLEFFGGFGIAIPSYHPVAETP